MPHIYASATDMDKSIQYINIHAEIQFKKEYFDSPKAQLKLQEIESDINTMLSKYFDDLNESEILSNYSKNYKYGSK